MCKKIASRVCAWLRHSFGSFMIYFYLLVVALALGLIGARQLWSFMGQVLGTSAVVGRLWGFRQVTIFFVVVHALLLWSLYNIYGITFVFFSKLVFTYFVILLSFMDLYTGYVSNITLLWLFLGGMVSNVWTGFMPLYSGPHLVQALILPEEHLSWLGRVSGALAVGGSLALLSFLVTWIYRALGRMPNDRLALGQGDIFFAATVAFYIGYAPMPLILCLGSSLGALLLLLGPNGEESLPFVPALGMAALFVYLF